MIATSPAVRPSSKPPRHPKRPGRPARQWTADELLFIRRNAATIPIEALADRFGVSRKKVREIGRRLGVYEPVRLKRASIGLMQFDADRAARLEATYRDLCARCRECGVHIDAVRTPAQMRFVIIETMRRHRRELLWQPPSILAAADLGRDDWFSPRPAASPTRTQPGSPDRVRVYVARVASGEELWHPSDVTCL